MSKTKDLILTDEHLAKFFDGKPIFELFKRELTVTKINNEILDNEDEAQEKYGTKCEQQRRFMMNVLTDTTERIKYVLHFLAIKNEDLDETETKQLSDIVLKDDYPRYTSKIFMIYLDELCRNFEAKLNETSAMKVRKQENIKNMECASEKLQEKIEKLIGKQQQKKAIVDVEINAKKQFIEKLKSDIAEMKSKCDVEILSMM